MESVRSKSWAHGATEADPALIKATELLKQKMDSQPTPQKGPKHINIEKNLNSDDVPGTRPGRNIEDVEREAIDHLFESHSGHAKAQYDLWKKPLKNIRNMLHAEKAPKEVTADEVLDATTTAAEVDEGQIDPITNRRTSKQRAAKTGSSTFTPKFEDVDHHPNLQSKATKDNYEKVQWNEPNGLPRTTREEQSKQYDDLEKYKPQKWNEPDGLPKETPEELSQQYNDLGRYKATQWNEPNGLQTETPEELSKHYTDLGQYGQVKWSDPDGLQNPTPEELSKNYKDLDSYGQIKWNEPDGLRKLTPEEKSKAYDDLGTYDGPRTAKDSAIQDYEAIQMDTTVKGNELPPKVEVAAENPGKEYTDLGEYKAVYWNEPDGLRKLTPEELSKDYEDLHLYGQVKWNEPDGLPTLTPEEQSKFYQDLPGYAQKDLSSKDDYTIRRHPEEVSKDYQDLGSYGAVRWNEPNGLPLLTPEELSKKYADLPSYGQGSSGLASHSIRRHPEEISKEYGDLGNYGTPLIDNVDVPYHVHPEEAPKKYADLANYTPTYGSKTEHVHPQEITKTYSDLDRYDPQNFDSPAPAEPTIPEEASNSYSDLGSYTQRSQPQGISSTGANGQSSGNSDGQDGRNGSKLDTLTPDEIRANVLRRVRKQDLSKEQHRQATAAVYRKKWDPIMKDAHEKLAQEYPRKMTGNFARDFPEEFTTSWSTSNSPSKSTLYPKDKAERSMQHESEPREELEPSSMDESFPSECSRLEPALNRHARRDFTGPVSQEPTKASTNSESRFQEAMKEAEQKLVAQQSTSKTAPGNESAAAKSAAPVTYKILAYDATTDLIRTASTSSTVNDTSPPLTPADVIPKLSNPAKFFVHFSGLQTEGYEIVSGERDVLVFRKAQSSPSEKVKADRPNRINPIDMMGKPPITGNFASPTGFVNYESLEERNPKPEPPFRSGIDVRREEPVYSGPKETGVGKEKKKRGLGKKVIIGTAYVAGGAYAVGVMGEYFATRGAPPRPGVEPVQRGGRNESALR